ncbi:MAG: STAS domain-containing protein [Pyrinomonadaceae bacterium]
MLKVHAKEMGTVAILSLQGQFVRGETEILGNAVHSLPEVSAVILDLARVTAVDAGGLGALLELRAQAESKGVGFELTNVTKWVGKVLEVTRLDSVFKITSGVEAFPAVTHTWEASRAALAPCA